MVVGVSFFSIASGIFTNIIQNADIENHKIAEKKAILDKILADYQITPNLYYELMNAIKFDSSNNFDEVNDFL
jgi:hypothetical protein